MSIAPGRTAASGAQVLTAVPEHRTADQACLLPDSPRRVRGTMRRAAGDGCGGAAEAAPGPRRDFPGSYAGFRPCYPQEKRGYPQQNGAPVRKPVEWSGGKPQVHCRWSIKDPDTDGHS